MSLTTYVLADAQYLFRNHYHCSHCGHTWRDVWTAMCDDRCPKCRTVASPEYSDELNVQSKRLPTIEIIIWRGLVESVRSDKPANIRTVDYDHDGVPDDNLTKDADGKDCIIMEYPAIIEPFKVAPQAERKETDV